MTLDEAIIHAQCVADTNCDQCAEDHRQLAEWLKELKELRKHGWHPASELPVIPEGKFSVRVMAYCHTPSGIYAPVEIAYTRTGGWQYESVKWWCYPPKEE